MKNTIEGQITHVLPPSAWQNVELHEGAAGLEEAPIRDNIVTGMINKGYVSSIQIRKPLFHMLVKAARNLPQGYKLVLIEGYRSVARQQLLWVKRWNDLAIANPDWDATMVDQEVSKITAKPNPLANHNCGGAIDVALADKDGNLVDMGAPYPAEGVNVNEYRTKFPMLSEDITLEQMMHRTILREAMEKAYFVWYPGKWWHYSWGDRMWAVYSRQKIYYFGPIEPA